MICQLCGGTVRWMGRLTNLTHTQCDDCGGRNCQEPEPTEMDEPDDDPEYLPTTTEQP